MPESIDGIQPVNIEPMPNSRPTRQSREDQEDYYPGLVQRQPKKESDEERNQNSQSKEENQDTYEHESDTPARSGHPDNKAKDKSKSDSVEGPGFVLDIKA